MKDCGDARVNNVVVMALLRGRPCNAGLLASDYDHR